MILLSCESRCHRCAVQCPMWPSACGGVGKVAVAKVVLVSGLVVLTPLISAFFCCCRHTLFFDNGGPLTSFPSPFIGPPKGTFGL